MELMDCIRAVSERTQHMKQAAAELGASMQRRHDLASCETITKKELEAIINKLWAESSHLLKSFDEKKVMGDALKVAWMKKSDSIMNTLMGFQDSGKLYYLELLLDLTDKGRSFDAGLAYSDVQLAIDSSKAAQIKARQPEVSFVTLQHLRDQVQDSGISEQQRCENILDYVRMGFIAFPKNATAAPVGDGAVPGGAGMAVAAPRRNDRRRMSDIPVWERHPWLPVSDCQLNVLYF